MKRFSRIAVAWFMAIFFFGFTYKVNAVVDTTPPTAPTNLTAIAVSPSQINLSWTVSRDNVGVKGYRVYRGTSLACSPIATTYTNTGLRANTQYCYSVKAIDYAGNLSVASSEGCVVTWPDTIPPTAPSNLTTTAVSPSQINLTWTASLDNVRVGGYWVHVPPFTNNAWRFAYTTSLQIGRLSAETQYCFVVKAFDTSGNRSVASSQQCATTCSDVDGDGFNTCTGPNHDCNDNNPAIHPGAAEIACDGIDQNCNGMIDDTVDVDSDGYNTCTGPNFDCDDSNPTINPSAQEISDNEVDEDCDGLIAYQQNSLGQYDGTIGGFRGYSFMTIDKTYLYYSNASYYTDIAKGFFTFNTGQFANLDNLTLLQLRIYVANGDLYNDDGSMVSITVRVGYWPDESFDDSVCPPENCEVHNAQGYCWEEPEGCCKPAPAYYTSELQLLPEAEEGWFSIMLSPDQLSDDWSDREYLGFILYTGDDCPPYHPWDPCTREKMYIEDGGNTQGTGNLPELNLYFSQ